MARTLKSEKRRFEAGGTRFETRHPCIGCNIYPYTRHIQGGLKEIEMRGFHRWKDHCHLDYSYYYSHIGSVVGFPSILLETALMHVGVKRSRTNASAANDLENKPMIESS